MSTRTSDYTRVSTIRSSHWFREYYYIYAKAVHWLKAGILIATGNIFPTVHHHCRLVSCVTSHADFNSSIKPLHVAARILATIHTTMLECWWLSHVCPNSSKGSRQWFDGVIMTRRVGWRCCGMVL